MYTIPFYVPSPFSIFTFIFNCLLVTDWLLKMKEADDMNWSNWPTADVLLCFLLILLLFPLGHGVDGVAYNYKASIEVTTYTYFYFC